MGQTVPAAESRLKALCASCLDNSAFTPLAPFPHSGMLQAMEQLLQRITHDPNVMGGKPCIRGMRVTAGTILGQLASGSTFEQLLADYPYLELDDIRAVLAYAAWIAEQRDLPLQAS